ncbi:translocation-enhancing protein TepA [Clostridia bacterium]|nr:translocation-enhancing protein TepA [Clostridia bacterium]
MDKEQEQASNGARGRQSDEEASQKNEQIKEFGQVTLDDSRTKIHLLCIIGEIEGHESMSGSSKTTKYEHILPKLAEIEDTQEIEGMLILLNTVGGDVEAGLAISEMIASLTIPTVSLVLGGSHSIGVPLAVSSSYSFIVPTGTMLIHPVRMSGTIIGVTQTYDYFKKIQDRITGFVVNHAKISEKRLEELMLATGILTKDVGTILIGEETVKEGLINEIGGIKDALKKLHELIDESKQKKKDKKKK